MAVEKITLNLIPTGETPTIHAAQFDKERAFQIELKEGEDDFSPTGYTIELQVRKVDNNIVTAIPSQVSGNIVTFLTSEQMTACSGTNLAELQISKNDMSIATLHFYLVVQRDVLAGGLSSQSDIYNLEDQIAAIVPEVIGDEYYTADQVDEKIAEIPTFDPTNYYDKTETNSLLSQKVNTSSLSTVAFTGSYDDLVDHPVIPDVSDYYTKEETYSQNEVNTLLSTKADTSSLSTVATSGSYDDLSDKPTIPGNASVLPISASDPTNTKEYIDNKTTLVKSASGSIVHITDGGDNIPVKSLVSQIVAVQDLHGYDKPWAGGAGKNKLEFPYTDSSKTVSGITYTVKDNGDIAISGTATATSYFTFNHARQLVGNGQYIFSKGTTDTVILGADRCRISDNAYINRYADNISSPTTPEITINIEDADNNYARFWISVKNGETVNTIIHPMIRLATETDPTFEPYSNICPITGFDNGVITVTDNDQITNTYTFAFGQTVYGGHFDNKGNLVVTYSFIASYNGETINEPWISSMDNYVPNTLPSIGAQVKYPLTTPIPLSITSQDIPTLLGENNIFSDCGDVEVEYFTSSADGIADLIRALM